MDYVKYLGLTLASVVTLYFASQITGISIGLFGAVGLSIGGFVYRAPFRYSAGYIAWIVSVALWGAAVLWLLHQCVDPVKCTTQSVRVAGGFWILIGMIVLHPVSYGIGRLGSRFLAKSPQSGEWLQIGSDAYKQCRRRVLEFCGVAFLVLLIVALIILLLDIQRGLGRDLLVLSAPLLAAIWVIKRSRNNNTSAASAPIAKPEGPAPSKFAQVIAEAEREMKEKKAAQKTEAEKNIWRRPPE